MGVILKNQALPGFIIFGIVKWFILCEIKIVVKVNHCILTPRYLKAGYGYGKWKGIKLGQS
jgi:hypothetical protein